MKKQTKKKRILKGGRFLGEGSYGCVIKPALTCSTTKTRIHSIDKLNKVSKIIKSTGSFEENNELYLSKILNKLDPQQKYFLSIIDYCPIKNVPSTRSNIARVRLSDSYFNNSSSSISGTKPYEIIDSKKLDEKFCPVDLSENPLNIIMQDGGIDLFNIAEYYRNNKHKHDILIKNDNMYIAFYMLLNDFKGVLKHLLIGLKLMHDNHFVNRDIKSENIMLKYDHKKHKIFVRYIDFGMSEYINNRYSKNEYNIRLSGSPELIAPEIYITYYTYKYKNNIKEMVDKIRNSIVDNVMYMNKMLGIKPNSLTKDINELYQTIYKQLQQKTLVYKYFGTKDFKNGYLSKSDIYSLGIAMYEFIYVLTENALKIEKQPALKDLLMNMICINPEKRFNVDQCLKHHYFSSSS